MSDTLTAADLAERGNEGAPHGKFIWYELMTSDQAAAIDFYGEVVGWTAADSGQKDISYTILSAGGQGVGGILQLTDKMREGGARPGWLGYIAVADTDAKAREIEAAGGTILMEPGDIPNVGRFALAADPGGAPFYLLTPLSQGEQPPALDPWTPGKVSWHELYSRQGQEAAFAFYSSQFGWETQTEMDMGPMGKYRIFEVAGEALGGMMDKPANMPVSAWNYYINVAGIDAAVQRIEAKGGKLIMGPMEVPGGSWVIQATDPQGAHFALISQKR
jgi:predicted enzyme related to lactoylglutathione lyase